MLKPYLRCQYKIRNFIYVNHAVQFLCFVSVLCINFTLLIVERNNLEGNKIISWKKNKKMSKTVY